MNTVRRASPDSEAVGSSEDEKPWPASMSFGRFPLKEGGVPGLPGGIWSTRSGSFKLSDKAKLDVRANVRLGAVNQAHAGVRATPSPSVSEGAGGALPFAIPLQPTPKTGRSLSHSTGQREGSQRGSGQQLQHHAGAAGHTALPLGLLAEEVDTESESEVGTRLTHTTSHPPMGSLMRTATLPPSFDHPRGSSDGSEFQGDLSPQPGLLRGQTFGAAFANLSLDHPGRRAQWQSSLGWDDVPNVNESRRHSLADIPTRRGSLAAGEPSSLSRTFTHAPQESEEYQHHRSGYQGYGLERETDRNFARPTDSDVQFQIPDMYRPPFLSLNEDERRAIEARRDVPPTSSTPQWGSSAGRPKKLLFIVSFKCSRADVFYLLDNTGLIIREGDLVIVEADRGQDLGTVQNANISPEVARFLKTKYNEEQYKWLMMYSSNKDGATNPNAQLQNDVGAPSFANPPPSNIQGAHPQQHHNLKPKAIKRLANEHEIKMLAEKEGNEAKAKRTAQQKVQHLRLQMEILDAEWQWDFQKLIFYYYADHYINFKDLITELYRIYKTRIWMSAINPASFSQHAVNQPPSGIGPGAVAPYNPYANNSAYTMAYGEDRDPYGALMPYSIPYETYTPNFPSIPGVANSFAPAPFAVQVPAGQNYVFYGTNPQQSSSTAAQPPSSYLGHNTFSAPGGPAFTGSRANAFATTDPTQLSNSYYERNGADLQPVPEDSNMQVPSPETPGLNPFNRSYPSIMAPGQVSSQSPQTPVRKQSQPPIGTRGRPQFGADPFGFPTLMQQPTPSTPDNHTGTPRSRLVFGQQPPVLKDSASPELTISGLAELGSGKKDRKNDEQEGKDLLLSRFVKGQQDDDT